MTTRTPEQHFARHRDTGDLGALAAVFDAVAGELLLIAGHLVRDGATAEDLVQTTFVEAMRHADRYDARRPLLPWLARILTHHAKKLQRQWVRGQRAQPDGPRGERGPVEHALDREAMMAIRSGLARLDPPYREVLTLRLVHDLSPAAIAHAIGCPPETVKTRLKRGLEHLRRRLPAGLATSLALLLASGRGQAALRADVLAHARVLTTKTAAGAAAGGLILGGLLMKQFLLWATLVVAVVLLAWWGVELSSADARAPQSHGRAVLAVASEVSAGAAGAPLERQALADRAAAAGGIVFTGRCVDETTGAPLANANAVVNFDVASRDVCDNELGADTPAARVASGIDGAFRLVCERKAGAMYDVRVGNREHVHRVRTFGPYDADRTIELGDVPLARGVHVSLRVVDRRGTPVPRVRITASTTWPVGRNDALALDAGYPWLSDAQGEIHLPYSLPPGRLQVSWWADHLPEDRVQATLEVPSGSAEHRAVLVWPVEDLADAILGEVVDANGNPVSDVSIGAEGGGTRGNARARADGTFRMVRIGPYDANERGPVEFGLPPPTCGLELVGAPTASWGDRGVRLVVREVAALRVRAVDAPTGETVRNIDVAFAAYHGDGAAPKVVWSRYSPLERLPDGAVRRRVARCPHDVQVFPQDSRLGPSFKVTWDPRDGDELVVSLAPLRACTVRVVASDGEPVAGTELWTLQPIEAVDGAPAATGWREVTLPVAEEQRLDPSTRWARHGIDDAPLGTTRSGADGRAQVLVPANADVVIAALGPGHVPQAIVGRAGTESEVELRVERGASVRFALTPKEVVQRLLPSARHRSIAAAGTDYPATGSVALLVQRIDAEPDPLGRDAAIVIPISPDGTCEHRGLRPGRYATAIGGNIESGAMDGIRVLWQPGPVTVRDGERNEIPIDVSRFAVGRLQCQVLLNGRPWAFGIGHLWSAELVDEQAGASGYLTHIPKHQGIVQLRTDSEGRFDVEAVPGDYRLHLLDVINARGGGNCCAVEPVHVVAGATQQLVLTARDVTARVRVVDAAGAPAPGLTVTADYTTVPDYGVAWTTDADGWITMKLAPPVPFHLIVRNPDGPMLAGRRTTSSGDAVLGPFQIPAMGDTVELRAVLPKGWR